MNNAPDPPAPRPRRRKLRIVFALGVLLAAFLVFLFLPDPPRAANPVHLQLRTLTTNAENKVEAVFVASNGWHRMIGLYHVRVEQKEGSEWYEQARQIESFPTLLPGEVMEFKAGITYPAAPWRAELVWVLYPPRGRIWAWNLQAAAGRLLPAMDPSREKWFISLARTNHWPETAR